MCCNYIILSVVEIRAGEDTEFTIHLFPTDRSYLSRVIDCGDDSYW